MTVERRRHGHDHARGDGRRRGRRCGADDRRRARHRRHRGGRMDHRRADDRFPTAVLTITLTHDFSSDVEATNLLNSIGPPFNQMSMIRNTSGDDTTDPTERTARAARRLRELRRRGSDRCRRLDAVRRADRSERCHTGVVDERRAASRTLPGEIDSDETNGTELDDDRLEWIVPIDGTILDARAASVQSPGDDRWWARPLSIAGPGRVDRVGRVHDAVHRLRRCGPAGNAPVAVPARPGPRRSSRPADEPMWQPGACPTRRAESTSTSM